MKNVLRVSLLPLALCAAGVFAAETAADAAAAQSRYDVQKVVYHFNTADAETQKAGLANIQNHINAVGAKNLEVRVVMHGDGLSLLLPPDEVEGTKMKAGNADDNMAARISGLKDQGVKFDICANTLKGRKVDLAALYDADEADVVPSGVAEISRLQQMGYTYLKP